MQVIVAIPERVSLADPVIVIESEEITAPSTGEVIEIAGAVASSFTIAETDAVLPALSTAVPETTCPAPSVLTATGEGHAAIPEPPSEQVKLTVTGALFQPFVLGGADRVAVMPGELLSIFNVTLVLAVFPALFTAMPETTWPAPSVLTTTGEGQVAMPELLSEQVKVTVTAVLFHPFEFAAGVATALIVGADGGGGGGGGGAGGEFSVRQAMTLSSVNCTPVLPSWYMRR